MLRLLLISLVVITSGASLIDDDGSFSRKEKLSEYNFFVGKLSDLRPAEGVIPYDVNAPLFSNYAEKSRFVKVPEGQAASYHDTASFSFPTGTILIKSFYYPHDARNPQKGRKILETRLLVNEESGWQAYPYIWNDEQTEAFYDPAGETKTVTFVNASGKKITTPYLIPNKNQCKGCHSQAGKMTPIGTTARQLNGNGADKIENQLIHWQRINILTGVPAVSPRLINYLDASTGSLDQRARSYLDANCAHCHSTKGPASTSGLFLDFFQTDATHLGVRKPPVAAGRGAADLQFDIEPGSPAKSILLFRMKTNDPAIAMPEIGREQIHKEGVALIEEWIRKNEFGKPQK